MTGVMEAGAGPGGIGAVDTDAVFSDMVLRLAAGMAHRSGRSANA